MYSKNLEKSKTYFRILLKYYCNKILVLIKNNINIEKRDINFIQLGAYVAPNILLMYQNLFKKIAINVFINAI